MGNNIRQSLDSCRGQEGDKCQEERNSIRSNQAAKEPELDSCVQCVLVHCNLNVAARNLEHTRKRRRVSSVTAQTACRAVKTQEKRNLSHSSQAHPGFLQSSTRHRVTLLFPICFFCKLEVYKGSLKERNSINIRNPKFSLSKDITVVLTTVFLPDQFLCPVTC